MSASSKKSSGKRPSKPNSASRSAVDVASKSEGNNVDMNAELEKLKNELKVEREERNYFMLERDKIRTFWEVTKKELQEIKATLLDKDREIEEQEEKHQVEIKIYKQKVKHLLYEYQNNVAHIQADHQQALELESEDNQTRETQLKTDKRGLKLELKELELSHEDIIRNIKYKHDQEITKLRTDFERRAKELFVKYERKSKSIRDDLELRRKNEIHEIEERKNGQINALMKNHEKAFAEIKNYYNDITLNNLALINSLKEQVEETKKKEERNEKLMAEITAENRRLSEPLQAALAEGENLRRQLSNYEKDKMSLHNCKARLKVLEDAHKSLSWEHEVLEQRFQQVQKERDELYEQFVGRIVQVQQKTGFKNMVLEKKLGALKESLERKELQINEIVSATNLDPNMTANITKRLDEELESKNRQIKELQYELAKVTKYSNDIIRTYQAKLTENSIPTDDFGLKSMKLPNPPLPTLT
ncbi:growth-arrest-specific micro-tubule binding-domain-containing protein [Paraphysoderma sedebokerense]|nr:growth-arrest-specific micro-tubule binding-domain-containing protein [Paraphysoderma sedebokerense]